MTPSVQPSFFKYGSHQALSAEREGLEAMDAHVPGAVPGRRDLCTAPNGQSVLKLDRISVTAWSTRHWRALADILTRLHVGASIVHGYGWPTDNFIGPTPQENGPIDTWPAFFRTRRLKAMQSRLRTAGKWQQEWTMPFRDLCDGIGDLLPSQPAPGLCHGDLWMGNVLPTTHNRVILIDPAIFQGDGWSDIAMLHLFGSVPPEFSSRYAAGAPDPHPGRAAMNTYALYHVMNHTLLFGPPYNRQLSDVLRQCVR